MLPLPLLLSLLLALPPPTFSLGPSAHTSPNAAHFVLSSERLSHVSPILSLRSSDFLEDERTNTTSEGDRDGGPAPGDEAEDSPLARTSRDGHGARHSPRDNFEQNGKRDGGGHSRLQKRSPPRNPKFLNPKHNQTPIVVSIILPPLTATPTTATYQYFTTLEVMPTTQPTTIKPTRTTTTTKTTSTPLSLPTPPSSNCYPAYTDTSSGAVFGPGLGSFAMSPRPSSFVTRSGAKLMLDGEVYRMVGPTLQVAYKNDPTILAWETGNELGGYMLQGGAPPAAWTANIASYIKGIAPNHLVSDGSDGLIDSSGATQNQGFSVSQVDMVTDHLYPALDWLLVKDNGILDSRTTKNYFIGELDWTGQMGGDSLWDYFPTLESIDGSGSMIWSVFGHDAQCCDFISHNDGYSLLYPNGNNDDEQSQILLVVQHWYRMRGLEIPNTMPAVACPQPALLP
ncbi:mannan endo-1,4-beta-mannosidase, partial [Phenoliferia sp. Uapishka_3]